MKTFYLHGYTSPGLTSEKKTALEQLDLKIIAPVYAYPQMENILPTIQKRIEAEKPDFLIGSSMGGRLAFYLSNALQLPALLFNPALVHPLIDSRHPVPNGYRNLPIFGKQLLILGELDTTVPPASTLNYLPNHYPGQTFSYHLIPGLTHTITPQLLKDQTKEFLKKIF
jgi:hypothetical protein